MPYCVRPFRGGELWASDNVTFSESDGTLTITLSGTASDDDVTTVKNKMNNSSYTKVVVSGGVITDAFVWAILYKDNAANSSITTLDFSKTEYSNETFAKTCINNHTDWDFNYLMSNLKIATFSFPKNIKTIASKALAAMTLKEVIFPDSLDKIDDAAFYNCKALKNLKFNSKLRYIGNSAFAVDAAIAETSIIIPSSVQYIGPAAFFGHCYQDVYFTSDRAPVMPCGAPVVTISYGGNNKELVAFDGATLMCNNGFNPADTPTTQGLSDDISTGYANRENYINHGVYMAILHYPNTITDVNNLKTYYDTTRKYETKFKEDGTFSATEELSVGDATQQSWTAYGNSTKANVTVGYKDTYAGDSYIWPSQSQWMRSYITAVNGVEWNGVTKYRTTLEQWEKDVLAEAGYTSDAGYSEDSLSYIAHLGTRMFVLANNDSRKDGDYVINMKGGKWWTLCVPFNMTKKQVSEVFGDKTNVCLFNKVERTISKSTNNNKIHLYFTVDVFKHKCESKNAQTGKWNYSTINENSAPQDDDIVIYAHESYMIHPSKTDDDAKFVVKAGDYDVVTGNPEPTIITSEVLTYVQDADKDNTPDYRFIGNYIGSDDATATGVQTVTVPAYSYAYAKSKSDTDYKFWFLTDSKAVWRANKCVVQTTNRDLGKEDETNFFGGNVTSAKQASYFGSADGGNGDTTSIDEEYVIIAGEKADAPIYSVEGRMVSRNGDTTGLSKGVYIQNGNKFIVK